MTRRNLESPDRDHVVDAMSALADRVATLVESATDPGAPVHGSGSWTVGDLVRHMSVLPQLYAVPADQVWLDWSPSASAMAETNATALAAVADRTFAQLPRAFRDSVPTLLDRLRGSDPETPWPWHAGITLTPGQLGSIAIGEWLVHGWELAKTLGVPWEVRPDHACLVLAGFNEVLPAWVDTDRAAGHSGRYEIRLRGTGRRLQWTFHDGVFTAQPAQPAPGVPYRPQTIVWADPAALLLFLYRRTGLWSNTVRGSMIAGGLRPDRALTMRSLFHPA